MLLRILVIGLLLLLLVRLLVRLAAQLGRRTPPTPPEERRTRGEPRRLVACPVCGDYFEPGHGLPAPGARGETGTVCSEACRRRRRAGGDRT